MLVSGSVTNIVPDIWSLKHKLFFWNWNDPFSTGHVNLLGGLWLGWIGHSEKSSAQKRPNFITYIQVINTDPSCWGFFQIQSPCHSDLLHHMAQTWRREAGVQWRHGDSSSQTTVEWDDRISPCVSPKHQPESSSPSCHRGTDLAPSFCFLSLHPALGWVVWPLANSLGRGLAPEATRTNRRQRCASLRHPTRERCMFHHWRKLGQSNAPNPSTSLRKTGYTRASSQLEQFFWHDDSSAAVHSESHCVRPNMTIKITLILAPC